VDTLHAKTSKHVPLCCPAPHEEESLKATEDSSLQVVNLNTWPSVTNENHLPNDDPKVFFISFYYWLILSWINDFSLSFRDQHAWLICPLRHPFQQKETLPKHHAGTYGCSHLQHIQRHMLVCGSIMTRT
jgi:hypothetical protein